MNRLFEEFDSIWCADFEFHAPDGKRPEPICMVARELRSGEAIRLWHDELARAKDAPFPTDESALLVAYYASAEFGCFLALDWPIPVRVLDLFAEFRCITNGKTLPSGSSLVGALVCYGLDHLAAHEKENMRQLAMGGGPFSAEERLALLDYCQTDVDALARLLPLMAERIDLPRALLRGRYMIAAARMEWTGVPIDTVTLAELISHWGAIRLDLIAELDRDFGVFDGPAFSHDRFARYLVREGLPWPRLPSGRLKTDDATFKMMGERFPQLQPLRELRKTLGAMKSNRLAVGADGRNRCMLSAFGSRTGRNQPSNSKSAYGLPAWSRSLIRPDADRALAYIDYEQQEFGIAAAFSGDPAMQDAYHSGDPYLTFAIQAEAAPPNATRSTHGDVRSQFKACSLGVLFGMGAKTLAQRIGCSEGHARYLLELHRRTYPRFWEWSEAAVDYAMLMGSIHTALGWRLHVGEETNPRSLANFPMQANGAEMLRLACCLLTENGIDVCAPVHDAVLIEAPIARIDVEVRRAKRMMGHASEVILDGFTLRTDVEIVKAPDRFEDGRGRDMWQTVTRLLDQQSSASAQQRLGHQ